MSKEVRRLGRGIASLVSPELTEPASSNAVSSTLDEALPQPRANTPSRFAVIPITSVRTNPAQPRREFDEAALQALADSLKSRGAIQPIAVRPAEGGYELLAGERRLRAAAIAGLDSLPAVIRPAKDEDLLELALVENIQRENLNPVEKAQAYKNLHVRYGLSHDEIGKRMGEDRATVSNYIRMLDLNQDVLVLLSRGSLGTGHAKALLAITDKKSQLSLAQKIVGEGWSVRQVEAAVAQLRKDGESARAIEAKPARPAVNDMEQRLSQAVGTRVRIQEGRRRHSGRITIEYYTLDDFDRIVALFGVVREPA